MTREAPIIAAIVRWMTCETKRLILVSDGDHEEEAPTILPLCSGKAVNEGDYDEESADHRCQCAVKKLLIRKHRGWDQDGRGREREGSRIPQS